MALGSTQNFTFEEQSVNSDSKERNLWSIRVSRIFYPEAYHLIKIKILNTQLACQQFRTRSSLIINIDIIDQVRLFH